MIGVYEMELKMDANDQNLAAGFQNVEYMAHGTICRIPTK